MCEWLVCVINAVSTIAHVCMWPYMLCIGCLKLSKLSVEVIYMVPIVLL